MFIQLKCPQCGELTSPLPVVRILDHQLIKCDSIGCPCKIPLAGSNGYFKSKDDTYHYKNWVSYNDQYYDNLIENSEGFNIRPEDRSFGRDVLLTARKFIQKNNLEWTVEETIEQCQNHLLIKYPELNFDEIIAASEVATAEIIKKECDSVVNRYSRSRINLNLSTSNTLCMVGDERRPEFVAIIPLSIITGLKLNENTDFRHFLFNKNKKINKNLKYELPCYYPNGFNIYPRSSYAKFILPQVISYIDNMDPHKNDKDLYWSCFDFIRSLSNYDTLNHEETSYLVKLAMAEHIAQYEWSLHYAIDLTLSTNKVLCITNIEESEKNIYNNIEKILIPLSYLYEEIWNKYLKGNTVILS